MEILFINPKVETSSIDLIKKFDGLKYLPSIHLYLASLTKEHFDTDMSIEFINEVNHSSVDKLREADLIFLAGSTPQANRMYEIAQQFQNSSTSVVLAGEHATAIPEESSQYADAIVLGEAESTWLNVIADFKRGKLQQSYETASSISNYNSFHSQIPYKLLDSLSSLYKEGRVYPLLVNSNYPINNPAVNHYNTHDSQSGNRSIDIIEREISGVSGKVVYWLDGYLTENDYTVDLLNTISQYNIRWIGSFHSSQINNTFLIEQAVKSGCRYIFLKIERFSKDDDIFSNNEKYSKCISIAQSLIEQGIHIFPIIEIGYDHDDEGIFGKIREFVQKLKLEDVLITILTPLPGSTLFKEYDNQKRIITKNWNDYYGTEVVFRPSNLSAEKLKKGYLDLMRDLTKLTYRARVIRSN